MNMQLVLGTLFATWYLTLLPLGVTLLIYYFLFRTSKKRSTLSLIALKPAVSLASIVVVLLSIYVTYASFTATNSTALLGLAGIVLGAIPLSILILLVVWAVLYIFYSIKQGNNVDTDNKGTRHKIYIGIAIVFLALLIGMIVRSQYINNLASQAERTTDTALMNKLSSNASSKVRMMLTYNPNIPVNLLASMSSDTDYGVKLGIALNKNTPTEILVKLSNTSGIDAAIAQNPNVSPELLREIASHKGYAPWYVAKNPRTPVDVLNLLASNEGAMVRQSVAENPNVTNEILVRLATDGYKPVSDAAKRILKSRGVE